MVNTSSRGARLGWLANRAIAKSILGDIDGAIQDINIALEGNPENTENLIPNIKSLLKKLLDKKIAFDDNIDNDETEIIVTLDVQK